MQAQQVVTLPSPLNQGYVWPSGAHLESLRFTHSQEKVSDCLSWVRCPPWSDSPWIMGHGDASQCPLQQGCGEWTSWEGSWWDREVDTSKPGRFRSKGVRGFSTLGKLLFMTDFRNRNDSPGRGWVDWKKLSRSGSHPGGVSVLQDLGPGAN